MNSYNKTVLTELFKNRAVMNAVIGAVLLVIGGIILTIALVLSSQITQSFDCGQDTHCQNALNMIKLVSTVAAAVLIISGVFMLIPRGIIGGGA
jgi:uncharacterized BrkB/YihY/UPF0761 family membrane protein